MFDAPLVPKNGPACTLPASRNLTNLKSLSIRNIWLPDQHSLLHCYFSLHPKLETEEESLKKCLYVSEVVYNTLNPQWRSIPNQRIIGGSLNKFIICAWDCSKQVHVKILIETIDMTQLMYIDSEEDIMFPSNTFLFMLSDGLYCTSEIRSYLVETKKITPTPMYEWKKELLKKGSKISLSVNNFENIYFQQNELQSKMKRLNDLTSQLAQRLKDRELYFEHIAQKNRLQDEIENLKNKNNAILNSIDTDKEKISIISEELPPKIEKLKISDDELVLKKIILEQETQTQCQKMENFKQIVLISKKSTLQLIGELEKIFPITKRLQRNSKSEYEWMICGFTLPHSTFEGHDEEQTATALGLVCHVVSMLAKYLDIPLRYSLVPKCSRSVINNVQSTKGQYPLYSRGVDSSRFQYAVFLLNKNVEQLLDSRDQGLKVQRELRETLPNLKKLLVILEQERESLSKKV